MAGLKNHRPAWVFGMFAKDTKHLEPKGLNIQAIKSGKMFPLKQFKKVNFIGLPFCLRFTVFTLIRCKYGGAIFYDDKEKFTKVKCASFLLFFAILFPAFQTHCVIFLLENERK